MTAGPPDAERAVQRLRASDAVLADLGITVRDVAPGRAVAEMRVTATMLQGHGTCHGGYLFLLADSAFAFACNAHGPPTVAAGASVEFLAPAHEGDVLVAEAVERAAQGRSAVYDVTVRRGQQVVAEFRGRSRTLPPRTAE